jgi:hypothetical protein
MYVLLEFSTGLLIAVLLSVLWFHRRRRRFGQVYSAEGPRNTLWLSLIFDGQVGGALGASAGALFGFVFSERFYPAILFPHFLDNLMIAFLIGWLLGGGISGVSGYILASRTPLTLRRSHVAYLGFLFAFSLPVGYCLILVLSKLTA